MSTFVQFILVWNNLPEHNCLLAGLVTVNGAAGAGGEDSGSMGLTLEKKVDFLNWVLWS